jgi:peptide/nickel transport system substrate-binding protein
MVSDGPFGPNRRELLRGLAVTGAGGLLAACGHSAANPAGAAPSRTPNRGGNLKIGMSGGSSSDTLDPHQGLTYLDTGRFEALYQPQVKLRSTAAIEYVLAEPITPHHGLLSEWIIKIRPGVTFHSGKDLTADDVVYTIQRIISKGFSGAHFFGPTDLKNVKALDKLTVQVPMASPFGSFVDQLAGGWYYLYVVPSGFDRKQPDGTGPFAFQSFTPGQRSVFVRNKNHWKHGLPYADALTIIDFSDNAAGQDALVTGSIQAAGQLDPPQILALRSASGVRPVASRTGQFKPFTMRVDQPPFSDVNVRQALRPLVDRQQLINSALDGFGVAAIRFRPGPLHHSHVHGHARRLQRQDRRLRHQEPARGRRAAVQLGHGALLVRLTGFSDPVRRNG